jgi:branched-subunit amino acid transport protein AzlD
MIDTFTKEMMIVIAMVIGTLITRFLPFLLFPAGKETPKFITYLGTTLPYATMALLVVYCLKGVTIFTAPHGLPELIAVLTVVLLHWYKKNSLLSIAFGTIVYMFLIQKVF